MKKHILLLVLATLLTGKDATIKKFKPYLELNMAFVQLT